MNRAAIRMLGVLGLSSLASTASADWNEFWARFERDKRRNQEWPLPFNQADQHAVRGMFGVMVQRGWEEQLVFQDFHFDPTTQRLNPLGERKLAWALSQVPVERAQLGLVASVDPELDRLRMQNLRTLASQMSNQGATPEVIAVRSGPAMMRGMQADVMTQAASNVKPGAGKLQGGTSGTSGGSSATPTSSSSN